LFNELYLQILFTQVSSRSHDVDVRLLMLTSYVFVRMNCNLVTVVE